MSNTTKATPLSTEIDELDPSELWTNEEREEYLNQMEENPLFMDKFTEVGNGKYDDCRKTARITPTFKL